jgi:hypothetical protein
MLSTASDVAIGTAEIATNGVVIIGALIKMQDDKDG